MSSNGTTAQLTDQSPALEQRGADDALVRVESCPACRGRDFVRMFRHRWPELLRCIDCGLRFTNPQPAPRELAEIYDDGYFRTFGYGSQFVAAFRAMKQSGFERLLVAAEKHCPVGRLLDVGSALGDLLIAARRRGWGVVGLEPNPWAISEANGVIPGATVATAFEKFEGALQSFDLVTCTDVFEHLRRPDKALLRFYELLRPGGGLVLTTIDAGSLAARILGPRWPHYHRDHLWYFTRPALRQLIEKAGFEMLECRRARKVFHLHYMLSILAHGENFAAARVLARWGLEWLPRRALTRLFTLREGLFLMARRPV